MQTAISQAIRRLPDDMDPPTLRKVNPADAPIMFLAVTSRTQPMTALDEFADTHIAQRLSMVNGVAQIQVFGSQKYAVRVYLDPEALSKRGLGLDKVVSAIQNANSNLPSGVLQGQARNFTVKSSGKLERAQNFNELIVAYTNGMPVRLSDIGRAENSVENTKVKALLNDERAIQLAVYRQPGANTVQVVKDIRALFPAIEARSAAGRAHQRRERPLRVHPGVDQRGESSPGAVDRPGRAGDSRVPAQRALDAHHGADPARPR